MLPRVTYGRANLVFPTILHSFSLLARFWSTPFFKLDNPLFLLFVTDSLNYQWSKKSDYLSTCRFLKSGGRGGQKWTKRTSFSQLKNSRLDSFPNGSGSFLSTYIEACFEILTRQLARMLWDHRMLWDARNFCGGFVALLVGPSYTWFHPFTSSRLMSKHFYTSQWQFLLKNFLFI